MKKMERFHDVKKAAAVLATALMLAGCGGQGTAETTGVETTAAEATEEEAAFPAESTETSAKETAAEDEEKDQTEAEDEEKDQTETEAEEKDQTEALTPKAIYDSIGQSVELPSMIEGDDSFISNYYGINPADLDGYVFASAEDATLADSVIIMKAKSQDAVENIVSALDTVIQQKAAEMENYLPEQYEIVAKSTVKTEGNYVYLVISKDGDSIESVIRTALK